MKNFNPTTEQLNAAAHLFICMALRDITKNAFLNIETQILSEGNYRNSHFGKSDRMGGGDEFIRDPRYTCSIVGIAEGSPADTDAGRFFAELDRRAQNAGFINGQNADCIADNNVIKAQNRLITAMKPITKLGVEDIVMLDHRHKLIDLTLKLFAPLIKTRNIEREQRAYFDEHIMETVNAVE